MKFLAKVFVSLLFCQAASSEPLFSEFFMHIQEEFNNLLTEVTEWTKNVEQTAVVMGKTFLQQLTNFVKQLTRTTAKNGKYIATLPSNLNSQKEFEDANRNVNDQVLHSIASVRDKVSQILKDAEATYNKGATLVNDILEQNLNKIEELASEFRNEYKDEPQENQQKIEFLVGKVVEKTEGILSVCCQEILSTLKEMLNNIFHSANKILQGVERAEAELKRCKETHPDNLQELIKCDSNAKNNIPSVEKMKDFLANMENIIFKVKYNTANGSCLSTAFNEIVRDIDELHEKIESGLNKEDKLVQRNMLDFRFGGSESSETDNKTGSSETEPALESPVTERSPDSLEAESPPDLPVTERPPDSPVAEYSSDSPVTELPPDSPVAEYSSDSPVTEFPPDSPVTELSPDSPETESLTCNYTFGGIVVVIPKIGDQHCPQQNKTERGVYILNN